MRRVGYKIYSRIQKYVYTPRWGLTGHHRRGWVTQPLRSPQPVQIITNLTIIHGLIERTVLRP